MKKRNIVFFVLTLAFSLLAVGCFTFALITGIEFLKLRAGNSDLGEAIGAVFLAVLSLISSIALWVSATAGGVFSGLNLRAGKKWLRVTSICILVTDALMAVSMAVLWIVLRIESAL